MTNDLENFSITEKFILKTKGGLVESKFVVL